MTAEIAVLNIHGVAMAADSAVSIGTTKVYNSANKLFALSKKHPVGIMVYGNAQTMSVPWETLIKAYRRELKDKKFRTISEYGESFINYLKNTKNIALDNELLFIENEVEGFIQYLSERIVDQDLSQAFETNPSLTAQEVLKIIDDLIIKYCDEILIKTRLDGITNEWVKKIKIIVGKIVENSISSNFEKIEIKQTTKRLLIETVASLFYAKTYSDEHSGVVISGFGDDEIYPSLVSYEIEWRLMGYLKYRVVNDEKITVRNTAGIVPFAQREMVDVFMEGCDRKLLDQIRDQVSEIFKDIKKNIFEGTNVRIGVGNEKAVRKNCQKIESEIFEKIQKMQIRNFVHPVLESVAALPLDELATMAQTLINITSFKRRVSLKQESVGGPIDVAVISKGDGFIWINRKHYFKPELNPHYFDNGNQRG